MVGRHFMNIKFFVSVIHYTLCENRFLTVHKNSFIQIVCLFHIFSGDKKAASTYFLTISRLILSAIAISHTKFLFYHLQWPKDLLKWCYFSHWILLFSRWQSDVCSHNGCIWPFFNLCHHIRNIFRIS